MRWKYRGQPSHTACESRRDDCVEQVRRQLAPLWKRRAAMLRALAVRLYAALCNARCPNIDEAFERWKQMVVAGCCSQSQLARQSHALAQAWDVSPSGEAGELLFAAQTAYAMVVKLLAARAAGGDQFAPGVEGGCNTASPDGCYRVLEKVESLAARRHLEPSYRAGGEAAVDVGNPVAARPFAWYLAAWSGAVAEAAEPIVRLVGRLASEAVHRFAATGHDLPAELFRALFPRTFRMLLGEYYTPEWLADHVLDRAGWGGRPDQQLVDPTCGSGTFLLRAIAIMRRRLDPGGPARGNGAAALPWRQIVAQVKGFDLSPLAVLAARANYLMAIADLVPPDADLSIPVDRLDVLSCPQAAADRSIGKHGARFDLLVGNPPWIAWDRLPQEYRARTESLWRHYGLFSLSAAAARHGGGKKELATLVLFAAADRYLKCGGRLSMVVPQNVLQTAGAGEGFRRFRLGPSGTPLCVLQVDDWTACRPFAGASHHVATVLMEKGSTTRYPVPYVKWFPDPSCRRKTAGWIGPRPPGIQQMKLEAAPACAHRPDSPWMVGLPGQVEQLRSLLGPSDYRAYLGANTAGANGVYWVEIVDRAGPHVLIRNAAGCSKPAVRQLEAAVEPDLLYPLVRWGDVDRFAARSSMYLLLAQDPETRTGIEPSLMRARFPKTLAYLEQFQALLAHRAAYRRYQHRSPFYSMYNVGHPTLSRHKVVWRRMDRYVRAAVLEPVEDPLLGTRPVVPQETCVLVPTGSSAEAHYLCAVLNSSVADLLVRSQSVLGGKGFASAGVLNLLAVRAFDAGNPLHRRLSELSVLAHLEGGIQRAECDLRTEIDTLVAELRRVPATVLDRSGEVFDSTGLRIGG